MPRLLLFVCFVMVYSGATAQKLLDTCQTNFRQYKGKLLVINEGHGVNANNLVYEHIIRKVAAGASAGDTINLFIELGYSAAWLLNKYLNGDSAGGLTQRQYLARRPYIRSLASLGIPVRIIAVDFEYDNGKRAETYVRFLDSTAELLNRYKVPNELLRQYIADLNKDGMWQKEKNRSEVISFYSSEQKNHTPASPAYNAIRDLVFVLRANHLIGTHMHRDNAAFRRFREAEDLGIVRYKGNYNILIHGAAHTDPAKRSNLYTHFRTRRSSPFRHNCYSIAQVYVNCTSIGDYFSSTKSKINLTPFLNRKKENRIIEHITHYAPAFEPNSVTGVTRLNGPSFIKRYEHRIPAWYIQCQTE